VLSLNYSPFKTLMIFFLLLPTYRREHDWILLPLDFGVASQSGALWMYVYLIPLPPPIALSTTFKKHENIKCHVYGQCIQEFEHASFTPIVLSATGGFAHKASAFYKHLASLFGR